MTEKIILPEIYDNPHAQTFLTYLRDELDLLLEKYDGNLKNRHVIRATERLNMLMNIYIYAEDTSGEP